MWTPFNLASMSSYISNAANGVSVLYYCNCKEEAHILSSTFNCSSILYYSLHYVPAWLRVMMMPFPSIPLPLAILPGSCARKGTEYYKRFAYIHITVTKATYFITLVRGALSCSMRSPPRIYTIVMSSIQS